MSTTQNMTPVEGKRAVSKQQRVRYANFSVKKDGLLERPEPSYSGSSLDHSRSRHAEPWNVEDVIITGKGIEIFQYAEAYSRDDTSVGPKVLEQDYIAWSVLFKQGSMNDICVREMSKLPVDTAKSPSTFIEVCFKYEGLPDSKDATQLKTKEPEDTTMDVAGDAEAEGADVEEGECTAEEVEMEEGEEGEDDEDDEVPAPDQLNLAKFFVGTHEFKDLEVRISFLRSASKKKPFQWCWPAVFSFLHGREGWFPHYNKKETENRIGLPLDGYIGKFGNQNNECFDAQPQEDGTTRWLMRTNLGRQQQQQPSHAGPVVPAFGAPLPKAPQLPPRPKSTLAPTLSGPVQSSKERTLEDIEAEEDRLEQEEERLRARRRELMEERRQLTQR